MTLSSTFRIWIKPGEDCTFAKEKIGRRNGNLLVECGCGLKKIHGRRVAHALCALEQESLLVFPHGSAALDECFQTLIGIFQCHELVQIDVLRTLEGILKTQSLT